MYYKYIQLYINRENKGIISTYIPIICISSIYLYLNLCSAVSVMIHNSVKTFFLGKYMRCEGEKFECKDCYTIIGER